MTSLCETTTCPTAPPVIAPPPGERRHVRADVVHARPHVGIHREVGVADEQLPVGGLRNWRLGDLEEFLVETLAGEQRAESPERHPPCDDDKRMDSLRGHLLIAGPSLVDPNFWRTVVLVGEHSEEGALGVVLNRASDAAVDETVPSS